MSEELARRYGLPKWQYTSSATHANTEAIRVARVATGREKVVMFDGKYHGHLDEALVELDDDRRGRHRGARRPRGHASTAPSSSRSTTRPRSPARSSAATSRSC